MLKPHHAFSKTVESQLITSSAILHAMLLGIECYWALNNE